MDCCHNEVRDALGDLCGLNSVHERVLKEPVVQEANTRDGTTANTRDGTTANTRDGTTANTRDGNTRDGTTANTRDGTTANISIRAPIED